MILCIKQCYFSTVDVFGIKCFTVPGQGLCFLPKTECDVCDVEVARAVRLGKTTIEPVAFRVPRVRVRDRHTNTRQH